MTSSTGKTADVGWNIGVSRTLPYPAAMVWDFLVSREGVAVWLGPGAELPREAGAEYETANGTVGEIRSFVAGDRVRLTWRPSDWDHDSTVQVRLSGSGAKTTLRFHQEWLADAEEREEQRAYWQDVTERVVAALAER
ncbi:SRPBCC domain-containing protein [Amycolatopsis balhimycina DSM 5908]|uniref:SRPBCC domain-containing protein n=1 Tax=Amycolatopsis balhimycina DSM 5908 TaxID=1081091 RepID=A0A428WX84_AMYBA|nr:SRPBCC domain-containing protein [Amycolatopsis balhimycina]RSM47671.1 SRPBCC domain-containing protein [Amycolatopsis balhimycina DSM 5908]